MQPKIYVGYSHQVKPNRVPIGSLFIEMDTFKIYINGDYTKSQNGWVEGGGATSWPLLADKPEYVQSASDTVLSFSDAEKAYQVGVPGTPVNTAEFTLDTTNETPGIFNTIHFNGPALPAFVTTGGRTVTIYDENAFTPFEDCIITVELLPDLNYAVYVYAPIEIPDTSGLATKRIEIVTIPDATYTLSLSDFGKILRFTSATAVTVTIPAGLVFGANDYNLLYARQAGAGLVTFVADAGVTANGDLAMDGENSSLTLVQVAADNYDVTGGVA